MTSKGEKSKKLTVSSTVIHNKIYYMYFHEISYHGDFNKWYQYRCDGRCGRYTQFWHVLVKKCDIFGQNRQAETGNAFLNVFILSPNGW